MPFYQVVDREVSLVIVTFSGLLTDADLVAPFRYWAKCGPPRVARGLFDFRSCDVSRITAGGVCAAATIASDCAFCDNLFRGAFLVDDSRMFAHAQAYKLVLPAFLGERQVFAKIDDALEYLGVLTSDPDLYLPVGDFGG